MGRHSDSSSESSDSDDSRRRRREKRGKKDKDKKSKRDKHSKKDKHGKRSKRSRTPERPKTLGLSTALQDIDIDKALEQDEQEIFRQALEQQKRRQPAAELGANNHNNQLIVTNADGTLTLAGSTALIAPDANSEKIRAYAQVARESRRVHVSHIPRGMDQDQLRQMFGVWCSQIRRQMIEMDVGRRLPEECVVDVDEVVDVYLNTRGAIPFAFIELTTDDMCTKLITGDLPVEFPLANGGTTKVGCRRPRDYRPMMQVDPSRVMMLGMSNPEASLSTFKQLFETLGEVKVFAVIPKRGYYVEYADAKSGEAACKALHGEVIGDRVIVVQPTTEAIRAWFLSLDLPVSGLFDEITSGLSGDIRKDVMGELLNLQIPLPQAIDTYIQIHEHLKLSWPMILPTRILCIFNAFDRAELDETDDSYDNLVLDIEEEVEKHGRVKRLIVPRELPKPPMPPDEYVPPKKPVPTPVFNSATTMPSFYPPDEGSALIDPTGMSDAAYQIELVRWQAEVDEGNKQYQRDYDAYLRARAKWDLDCMHPVFGTPGLGRCYVEYETVDEAAAAQAAIAGRLFGGRTVVTSFLFEDVLYPPPEDEEEDVTTRGGDDVKDAPAPSDEPSTAPATAGAAEGTTHNNAADDID